MEFQYLVCPPAFPACQGQESIRLMSMRLGRTNQLCLPSRTDNENPGHFDRGCFLTDGAGGGSGFRLHPLPRRVPVQVTMPTASAKECLIGDAWLLPNNLQ